MATRCCLLNLTIILLISLTRIINSESLPNDENQIETNRLPKNVEPISYELEFQLDQFHHKDRRYFNGRTKIDFKIHEETNSIILHAKDLIINDVKLEVKNKNITLSPLAFAIDTKKNFLIIEFEEELHSDDKCKLLLDYRGLLNDVPEGVFRYNYEQDEQIYEKLWFLGTNFKHHHARQAFPCFEEPHFKATFKILINHSSDYVAISNTLKQNVTSYKNEQNESISTSIFDETPIISTHAIAFTLSHSNLKPNGNNTVFMREKLKGNSIIEYVSNFTNRFLNEFEEYTNVSLNINNKEKITTVVVPLNYGKKVINQNWGLFVFSEEYLVSLSTRQSDRVAFALLFGSLMSKHWLEYFVTPDWSNNKWLANGFANYFQYFITDKIEKNWRLMDLFVIDNIQKNAFLADSSASAVPINHKLLDSKNIISNKAGAIIRMMTHVIGEDLFKTNLRNYIKTMSHQSATHNDLFDKLNSKIDLTEVNLTKIFINWIDTPGFPIIDVKRNYNNGNAIIKQERYLLSADGDDSNNNERYYVAINYAQNSTDFLSTEVTHWFHPNTNSLTITKLMKDKWVILNKQHFGYYRVNYDVKNWNLIIETLKSQNYQDINILNRAQLLDDAFSLARISKLNYSIVLRLVSYLRQEKDYIPWRPAMRGLLEIRKILFRTKYWEQFKKFSLNFIQPMEKSLGYYYHNNETYLEERFRNSMISFACQFGSEMCGVEGPKQVKKWLSSDDLFPKPHDQLFCAGVRYANESMRMKIFNKIKTISDQSLMNNLFYCVNENVTLDLFTSMSKKPIFLDVLHNVAIHSKIIDSNADCAINFILNKFSKIKSNILEIFNPVLKEIFTNIGQIIRNQEQISEFKKLNLNNEDLDKALSVAEKRMDLADKVGSEISDFLYCTNRS